MHVQIQPATASVATAAANTQVQVTIAAPGAGYRIVLTGAYFAFSGAVPAAPVRATIDFAGQTIGIGCSGGFTVFEPDSPLKGGDNGSMTLTLPAGGASAVGDVAALYYIAKSSEA
jgi:hypothetical protein